jgi:hypothetical protein
LIILKLKVLTYYLKDNKNITIILTTPTRIKNHIERAYIHFIPEESIIYTLSEAMRIVLFKFIMSFHVYDSEDVPDQDISKGVSSCIHPA